MASKRKTACGVRTGPNKNPKYIKNLNCTPTTHFIPKKNTCGVRTGQKETTEMACNTHFFKFSKHGGKGINQVNEDSDFYPLEVAMPSAKMQHAGYNTNDRAGQLSKPCSMASVPRIHGQPTSFLILHLDEKYKRAAAPGGIVSEGVVGEHAEYGDFHGN